MKEMEPSDVFEAAARAIINERCASAFLHDVRGSMQALFSALELLGRSARTGAENPQRVEKACDLATRAIAHHEKSTMEILERLTSAGPAAAAIDLAAVLAQAIHFLRNDAATKGVALKTTTVPATVRAPKYRLQTMLVGLLTAAIDYLPPRRELLIDLTISGDRFVITFSSSTGADSPEGRAPGLDLQLQPRELILAYARQLMVDIGGSLVIAPQAGADGELQLYFPSGA